MKTDLKQIFILIKFFPVLQFYQEIDILEMINQLLHRFDLIEKSVLVIGQEKGEDLNSRIERNFGMMRPEGYRKCIRLMKLADRFQIPVISFC